MEAILPIIPTTSQLLLYTGDIDTIDLLETMNNTGLSMNTVINTKSGFLIESLSRLFRFTQSINPDVYTVFLVGLDADDKPLEDHGFCMFNGRGTYVIVESVIGISKPRTHNVDKDTVFAAISRLKKKETFTLSGWKNLIGHDLVSEQTVRIVACVIGYACDINYMPQFQSIVSTAISLIETKIGQSPERLRLLNANLDVDAAKSLLYVLQNRV